MRLISSIEYIPIGHSVAALSQRAQLFMLVGQGAAAPLAEHRAGLPPALYQVIDRAMARRPEERFASGLALADALGAVLRAEGADVDPVELGTHVADVRRAMAAG